MIDFLGLEFSQNRLLPLSAKMIADIDDFARAVCLRHRLLCKYLNTFKEAVLSFRFPLLQKQALLIEDITRLTEPGKLEYHQKQKRIPI